MAQEWEDEMEDRQRECWSDGRERSRNEAKRGLGDAQERTERCVRQRNVVVCKVRTEEMAMNEMEESVNEPNDRNC